MIHIYINIPVLDKQRNKNIPLPLGGRTKIQLHTIVKSTGPGLSSSGPVKYILYIVCTTDIHVTVYYAYESLKGLVTEQISIMLIQ